MNAAGRITPAEMRGKPVLSRDPRKPAIMAALKSASGCRKVTMVTALADGYAGNCMNGPAGNWGLWFVPSTAVAAKMNGGAL